MGAFLTAQHILVALPLLLAGAGIYAGAMLGVETTRRSLTLGGEEIQRSQPRAVQRAAVITGLDALAVLGTICLVVLLWRESVPHVAIAISIVSVVQALTAFTAIKEHRLMLRDNRSARPSAAVNWNDRAVSEVRPKAAETPPMVSKRSTLTREQRLDLSAKGEQRFRDLKREIEKSGARYVAISVNTGKYSFAAEERDFSGFAQKLSPDDFLWLKRVGN